MAAICRYITRKNKMTIPDMGSMGLESPKIIADHVTEHMTRGPVFWIELLGSSRSILMMSGKI